MRVNKAEGGGEVWELCVHVRRGKRRNMASIGAAEEALAEERSTPGGHETVPEQLSRGHEAMTRVQNCEAAPPCALPAAGIPRIVILDENAVYDHYMRRLNRVWARRMKVSCSVRCKALLLRLED